MTELELTARILQRARAVGVLAHHCPRSERCQGTPGLPDLILLGEHGLALPELKGDDGETSADQDLWIWTATRAGILAPVWRRAQLEDGTVDALLRRMA